MGDFAIPIHGASGPLPSRSANGQSRAMPDFDGLVTTTLARSRRYARAGTIDDSNFLLFFRATGDPCKSCSTSSSTIACRTIAIYNVQCTMYNVHVTITITIGFNIQHSTFNTAHDKLCGKDIPSLHHQHRIQIQSGSVQTSSGRNGSQLPMGCDKPLELHNITARSESINAL